MTIHTWDYFWTLIVWQFKIILCIKLPTNKIDCVPVDNIFSQIGLTYVVGCMSCSGKFGPNNVWHDSMLFVRVTRFRDLLLLTRSKITQLKHLQVACTIWFLYLGLWQFVTVCHIFHFRKKECFFAQLMKARLGAFFLNNRKLIFCHLQEMMNSKIRNTLTLMAQLNSLQLTLCWLRSLLLGVRCSSCRCLLNVGNV